MGNNEIPRDVETPDGDIIPNPDRIQGTWVVPTLDPAELGHLDQAAPPVNTTKKTPETTDPDAEKLSREARLELISREKGFFPADKRELSLTTGLLALSSAKQLNEILLHQKKAGATAKDETVPQRTINSLVDEFRAYAHDSRFVAGQLRQLVDRIEEGEFHPFDGLSKTELRHWQDDGLLQRLVSNVVRYTDTGDFINGQADDRIGEQYSATKQGKQHIEHTLRSLRVGQFIKLAEDVIANHQSRYLFWVEQLKDARRHNAARGIATAALNGLDPNILDTDKKTS